ncbi:PREDICTED: late secretory pathway protein AVL9 homolog [Priapulus caudatus]|uniref:Late secretory pathway protein AVL9 homolog n=1 Tax=Priapulus caudatus TaxID=37621 RepID=A0ABM1EZR1_PRICU|nr:PREDICTED: late secretory pathway protein AVL9 homolog [Priapulus caudatus]
MDSEENRNPILHVVVVGFHHKRGCQVEYAYPPFFEGDAVDSHELPDEWRHLPSLAIPDGAHNFLEDSVFFHLPSRESARKTVFGVSCYRQIAASELRAVAADVTRATVQKSVCVLTRAPLYGVVRAKLELITHAYFDELDFSRRGLLEETYRNLSAGFAAGVVETSSPALGLSARELVTRYRHRLLALFKLLMLERRVLFFGAPVRTLSGTVLALVSLFPGALEMGMDEAAYVRPRAAADAPEASAEWGESTTRRREASVEWGESTTRRREARTRRREVSAGVGRVDDAAAGGKDAAAGGEDAAGRVDEINDQMDTMESDDARHPNGPAGGAGINADARGGKRGHEGSTDSGIDSQCIDTPDHPPPPTQQQGNATRGRRSDEEEEEEEGGRSNDRTLAVSNASFRPLGSTQELDQLDDLTIEQAADMYAAPSGDAVAASNGDRASPAWEAERFVEDTETEVPPGGSGGGVPRSDSQLSLSARLKANSLVGRLASAMSSSSSSDGRHDDDAPAASAEDVESLSLEDCGFPLDMFGRGAVCHPYMSLSHLDLAADPAVTSLVGGATNGLFRHKRKLFDVVVDVVAADDGAAAARVDVVDPDLGRLIALTAADLRFADRLVRTVADADGDDSLWEGGDEWIRLQFKWYLVALLSTYEAATVNQAVQQTGRAVAHTSKAVGSALTQMSGSLSSWLGWK